MEPAIAEMKHSLAVQACQFRHFKNGSVPQIERLAREIEPPGMQFLPARRRLDLCHG